MSTVKHVSPPLLNKDEASVREAEFPAKLTNVLHSQLMFTQFVLLKC